MYNLCQTKEGKLITLAPLNPRSIKKALTMSYGIKVLSCRSLGDGRTAIVVPFEYAEKFNNFANEFCIVNVVGGKININPNSTGHLGYTEVVCMLNKTRYDREM